MNIRDRDQGNQPFNASARSLTVQFKVVGDAVEALLPIGIGQLSPTSLAYLGDAIYELYIRTHYLLPPRRISDYHRLVVAQVRAESQAAHFLALEPHLTELEQEIARRGRNAVTKVPRRLSGELYRQATSFETLLGYLYLKNPQRLNQLLEQIELN